MQWDDEELNRREEKAQELLQGLDIEAPSDFLEGILEKVAQREKGENCIYLPRSVRELVVDSSLLNWALLGEILQADEATLYTIAEE